MKKQKNVQNFYELAVDFAGLILSTVCSFLVFEVILNKLPDYTLTEYIEYFFYVIISFLIVFFMFLSSIDITKRNRVKETFSVLRNDFLIIAMLSVFLLVSKHPMIESRYMYLGIFLFDFLFTLAGRFFLKHYMPQIYALTKNATLCGVITTSDRAEKFISNLSQDWTKQVCGAALIDAAYENGAYKFYPSKSSMEKNSYSGTKTATVQKEYILKNEICGVPIEANYDNFMEWIRTSSLDEIFINLPHVTSSHITPIIEELESMGIVVHINVPSLEQFVEESHCNNFRAEITADIPMATFQATVHDTKRLIIKRLMDIAGGLLGCIISLPIILVVAIPLLIESPGPLIFKQQRIGRNGRIFNIYKLRSMYVDAEQRKQELMKNNKMNGLMFKMDNDPRITKVGKFIRKTSIDELPQFWNVLKGDMSLVGTRPPTVDEFEQYQSHHKRRLSMRPGITGMWQTSGRSDIQNFEDVVKLDLEYIDNWSLSLDVLLMFKTIKVVLRHEGAE